MVHYIMKGGQVGWENMWLPIILHRPCCAQSVCAMISSPIFPHLTLSFAQLDHNKSFPSSYNTSLNLIIQLIYILPLTFVFVPGCGLWMTVFSALILTTLVAAFPFSPSAKWNDWEGITNQCHVMSVIKVLRFLLHSLNCSDTTL